MFTARRFGTKATRITNSTKILFVYLSELGDLCGLGDKPLPV